MTAMNSMNFDRFSCSTSAVSASAHMIPFLDTAIILAVSICVLSLPLLRIMGLGM